MSLGVAGCACFPLDLPVASWMKTPGLPRDVDRYFALMEIFAHGAGITTLFLALLAIDRSLRVRPGWPADIARMVAAVITAGVCQWAIKMSVERVRPRAADLESLASILGTFGTSALSESRTESDVMSFPSGHAAAAAAFAAALAWRYPHGARAFAALAALAAIQRVTSSAHYPSDIAFGAAVGLLAASVWLGPRRGAPAAQGVAANPRVATSSPA